jgi:YesN/AraC family two-component response regulator
VRQLRNHPRLSQAPFILYGQEDGEEAALTVGMTNVVVKPISGETLMETINALCPTQEAGPILIVDDDPEVLDLHQAAVSRGFPGYAVRTAADGVAALTVMGEVTPSLVILDLMMPEMDGFDVLDRMRASERLRHVPVLILSNRMLNLDDVKRLEQHAMVTLQSKGVLSEDEAVTALHRALFGDEALPPHTSGLVKRAVVYFQHNYDRPLSRWEVAEAVGVSEDYLSRVFRREMGISPWEYLNRYRVLHAKELLCSTSDNIRTVGHRVGFTDPAYFSRVFRKVTGQSPSAYRQSPPQPGM